MMHRKSGGSIAETIAGKTGQKSECPCSTGPFRME